MCTKCSNDTMRMNRGKILILLSQTQSLELVTSRLPNKLHFQLNKKTRSKLL